MLTLCWLYKSDTCHYGNVFTFNTVLFLGKAVVKHTNPETQGIKKQPNLQATFGGSQLTY